MMETIENIDEVFLKVIDDHIAGDPVDEKIRWTNLSQKKIASKMSKEGINISPTVVRKLLKKHGFKKRKALKKLAIGSCENRNDQFKNIARLKKQYINDGNPVISVDTKKKSFQVTYTGMVVFIIPVLWKSMIMISRILRKER